MCDTNLRGGDHYPMTAILEIEDMKEIIPINATKDGIAPRVPSHYYKAGARDFMPKLNPQHIPHLAILEIMEEPKPIQVAQIYDQEQNPMNGRVYSPDGIAPTLRTPTGGLSEPKILQVGSYSPSSQCNAKVLDPEGICPTLLDHKGAEPAIIQNPHGFNKGGTFTNVAPTVTSSAYQNNNHVILRYRIRKLTPTECFRLMGVDDADIEKIDAYRVKTVLKNGKVKENPMPRTKRYALAGNSIVTNVLYHIFKSMFIDEPPRKPRQLSSFD